jgi:hypothetical protein
VADCDTAHVYHNKGSVSYAWVNEFLNILQNLKLQKEMSRFLCTIYIYMCVCVCVSVQQIEGIAENLQISFVLFR